MAVESNDDELSAPWHEGLSEGEMIWAHEGNNDCVPMEKVMACKGIDVADDTFEALKER
jgi:hypothetical protein